MIYSSPTLPCLSVRQPWASLIAANIKPLENRVWPCRYRGPILIHASKTWSHEEENAFQYLLGIAIDKRDNRRHDILISSRELRGGIIALTNMRDCIPEDEWYGEGGLPFDGWQSWYVGPYGFVCTGSRFFPRLVPWRGQQGIFRVPMSALSGVMEEIAMRKFYVEFVIGREIIKKPMIGFDGPTIAVEIRTKYPTAKIKVIKLLGRCA